MSLVEWLLSTFSDKNNITLALVCVILGIYLFRWWNYYSGTPPGPWGLPVVGYLPFLGKAPHVDFERLGKQYGDLFAFNVGSRYMIVLHAYDVIKEGFVKYGDFYAGKPNDSVEAMFGNYISMFVTEGEETREQRRFLLSVLRDFGFGKNSMEHHIQRESQEAAQFLRSNKGQPTDAIELTRLMAANAIACLIFGKRFPYDDKKLIDGLYGLFDSGDEFSFFNTLDVFPILWNLPGFLTGANAINKIKDSYFKFVDEIVEDHEKNFDENDPRDLIDVYLAKFQQLKTQSPATNKKNVYTKEHMRVNIVLLFSAGVDTTSTTTAWFLKIMAAYPEVQKKIQKEIDNVIGRERLPSMNDRLQMPYTEAAILETHRFISLVPQTFYHRIMGDTTLKGCKIPNKAIVVANLWNVHHDPKIWKDPMEFQPERFLGEEGKKLREYVIPFSIGKRNCLGESLAKTTLFIYVTGFLQHFTFERAEEPKDFTIKAATFAPISRLKSYMIRAVERT